VRRVLGHDPLEGAVEGQVGGGHAMLAARVFPDGGPFETGLGKEAVYSAVARQASKPPLMLETSVNPCSVKYAAPPRLLNP